MGGGEGGGEGCIEKKPEIFTNIYFDYLLKLFI